MCIDFPALFSICKSAGNAYGGSNPPAPTKTRKVLIFQCFPGFSFAKIPQVTRLLRSVKCGILSYFRWHFGGNFGGKISFWISLYLPKAWQSRLLDYHALLSRTLTRSLSLLSSASKSGTRVANSLCLRTSLVNSSIFVSVMA